jgi:hypothetical protein
VVLNKETAEIFISALQKTGNFKDFIRGLAKAGDSEMLRSVMDVMGRERFQQSFVKDGSVAYSSADPVAAAIESKEVGIARLLIDVFGGVRHSIVSKPVIRGQMRASSSYMNGAAAANLKADVVSCSALDKALGISYGALHPKQGGDSGMKPDLELIALVLDACPDVHPETHYDHGIHQPYVFGFSCEKSVSLLSLAFISRDDGFVKMMMDRDPVFTLEDLSYAVYMGYGKEALEILNQTGSFPDCLFSMMNGMSHGDQDELVAAMVTADIEMNPSSKYYCPRIEGMSLQAVLLMQEKCGVDMDLMLLAACKSDNADAVRGLIEAGANVNALNKSSNEHSAESVAPLHEVRSSEVLRILLAAGADPNIQSSKALTPIQNWLTRYSGSGSDGEREMPGMIGAIAQGGADMAVKSGSRSLLQMASKWSEDVRRAIRSSKTAMALEGALDGGDSKDAPLASSSSFSGQQPL